jgi:hypothetical protein
MTSQRAYRRVVVMAYGRINVGLTVEQEWVVVVVVVVQVGSGVAAVGCCRLL